MTDFLGAYEKFDDVVLHLRGNQYDRCVSSAEWSLRNGVIVTGRKALADSLIVSYPRSLKNELGSRITFLECVYAS